MYRTSDRRFTIGSWKCLAHNAWGLYHLGVIQNRLEVRCVASNAGFSPWQTREITATYTKDDAVLEVVLKVPPAYPLRAVEVDGTKRVGVSEGKWKKWALSMRTLLDNKDGSLLDAILLWKHNIDQVFEDVEECPICYTVLHIVNNSLPRMACHTCRNKFHSACLSKWFNTSNKSTCPLCQSPWYS
ncbi:hypothetical protein T484DRAFT_1615982 [Baffinella frigidus]|nr:hypothetical protein T484DRAFT_1615982 [Cryptophyta sp. CCMP2293]